MPSLPVMVLPLLAFAGGMAGLILLKMLAKTHQPMKLALTGVALSACWASLTDYLMLSRPQDVNNALLWLTGSLWGRDWSFVKIAIPLMILFLPLSLSFAAISTSLHSAMRAPPRSVCRCPIPDSGLCY